MLRGQDMIIECEDRDGCEAGMDVRTARTGCCHRVRDHDVRDVGRFVGNLRDAEEISEF